MKHDKVHPDFTLNGSHFSFSDLREVGYSLVKEGSPYEQLIGDFLLDWTHESPTLSVQTSGSTSTPKEILLKKQHMINSALATGDFFDLRAGDRALLCLPSNYIAGKMMLVRAMVLGLRLDYVMPSTQPLFDTRQPYDFCAMVPMQLQTSLEKLHTIRTLIIGGAPISMPLYKQLQGLKTQTFETYGMTETCTHIAVKRVTMEGQESDSAYFKALPNITLSQDERNCLVIEAPTILDSNITTNDVVQLASKTEFLWLGRHDNVVNSGGVKLFPEAIERKLVPLLSTPFFVSGVPDQTLGEKLVLVVEGSEKPDLKKNMAVASTLMTYEIPKTIHFLPKFILTETGKINRSETLKLL